MTALTVAMSVYNSQTFLAEAIRSVLAQDLHDFEFLVLDDGSTDDSLAIIRAFAAQDGRIRIIARENRGLVASLNELIAAARTPLIARMDADDICLPTRFSRQISFLDTRPDYGVVGCWTEDIDEHGAPFPLDGPDHPVTHDDFLAAIPTGAPLMCHPAAMYRREIVRSVGGYHAAFRHCEDLDLWLRLASVTRLGNIPERLVRYRHYAGQVSNRHAFEQQVGAAVSRLAYRERMEGRPDPTESMQGPLPAIAELDRIFGRPDACQTVRRDVVMGLLYSRTAMRGAGFDLLLDHLRDGGREEGLWRTVARLVLFGEPWRAMRLATTLALS